MLNVAQEQFSSGGVADMLPGLNLDENVSRVDASGNYAMLRDGLGSTIGLVNSAGALGTQYQYGPFGQTTTSGASSTNPLQYTGRELDSTGLDFMRARYYNPIAQRFISPDPIGLSGGQVNLYAYVGNSPTNWTDPQGLSGGSSGGGGGGNPPCPVCDQYAQHQNDAGPCDGPCTQVPAETAGGVSVGGIGSVGNPSIKPPPPPPAPPPSKNSPVCSAAVFIPYLVINVATQGLKGYYVGRAAGIALAIAVALASANPEIFPPVVVVTEPLGAGLGTIGGLGVGAFQAINSYAEQCI